MTRPIKIDGTDLKEMTDAEMDYIIYRVLTTFASTENNPGSLTTTSTSNTLVGTFADTKRVDAIGVHPTDGSITTTNTSIYQNLQTTSIASTRPLFWDVSQLKELTNTDLNSTLIPLIANELVNGGVGSYRVASVAPTGGTWVQAYTITDTAQGGDTTTYIWRKTNDTAPTTVRPVKQLSGDVREMTDAEINTLVDALREYIRTTGIGQYSLSTNAPVTGTWVQQGDNITDTRQAIASVNYRNTVGYTGTYRATNPYYQFADYDGTYYQFATYDGTYFQFSTYDGTYYQFATYDGTYYQFATYDGTYFQFADYSGTYTTTLGYQSTVNYQTTLGYTGTYRRRIGYVLFYTGFAGTTYYQFANYDQFANYYQFADYTGTYRATVGYTGTYQKTLGYIGTYQSTVGYTGTYQTTLGYTGTYQATVGYTGTYRKTNPYYQFADYDGTYYQFADYAGDTIQNTKDTVSTTRLWLRTA